VRLTKGASLASMEVASGGDQLLVLTEKGYGKRTPVDEYPTHHRGGGGVITFKIIDKTGPVVAGRMVRDDQELIIISRGGIVLRTRMEGISIQGRSTQGVSVIGIGEGDAVGSVATIDMAPPQGSAPAEGPDAGPSNGDSPSSESPTGGDNGGRGRAPRTPKPSNGPAASRSRPKAQAKPSRVSGGKTIARRTAPKAQARTVKPKNTAASPKRASSPRRALARADAAMRRADKAISKTRPSSRPAPPKKTPAKKPKQR
jgi:hypothetical protein